MKFLSFIAQEANSATNVNGFVGVSAGARPDRRAALNAVLAHKLRSPACHTVSYTHLRAHETVLDLVCRLLLEKNQYNIS